MTLVDILNAEILQSWYIFVYLSIQEEEAIITLHHRAQHFNHSRLDIIMMKTTIATHYAVQTLYYAVFRTPLQRPLITSTWRRHQPQRVAATGGT